MDRERRRQAVITAGLGIFIAWMSSGGADIMRRRREAHLHLAALALVYIASMDSAIYFAGRGAETAAFLGRGPEYYGPGFRYDAYTLTNNQNYISRYGYARNAFRNNNR